MKNNGLEIIENRSEQSLPAVNQTDTGFIVLYSAGVLFLPVMTVLITIIGIIAGIAEIASKQ